MTDCTEDLFLSEQDAEELWTENQTALRLWIPRIITKTGMPNSRGLAFAAGNGAGATGSAQKASAVKLTILRDEAFVEDIVSEVGCAFFQAVKKGRVKRDNPPGLLHVLAKRTTWRMVTERASRMMSEVGGFDSGLSALDLVTSPSPSPEAAAITRQALLRLRAAIERLPRADRELLLAAATDERLVDVAVRLGTSEVAVRQKLWRIRGRIRVAARLSQEGEERVNQAKNRRDMGSRQASRLDKKPRKW